MAQPLQIKRGNDLNFESVNLKAGEPAFVLDTKKLYIGDGTDKILINPDTLSKTNEEEYVPTSDYHPSTKKYVDDIARAILESVINSQFVLQPVYITGTQAGDEPPEDKSKLWLKPIN